MVRHDNMLVLTRVENSIQILFNITTLLELLPSSKSIRLCEFEYMIRLQSIHYTRT